MDIGVWVSLFAYFALMIAIGVYAMRKATSTSEDYMLGGRTLSPKVAALSAGASDMSGWLLLGLPGAMFVSGLGSAWIGIGLFVGALFNWILVAPRLREQTVHYGNAITIPAFLANRFPTRALSLRTVSAIVIVIFFAVYTASGLVAGGKLFESAFAGVINIGGMSDYAVGVVITLFDQGILNGNHIAILAPAIYLMGSQVQYMGRTMGPIGTEGRYIPVMIAISVLNAFGAMFLMNIIL